MGHSTIHQLLGTRGYHFSPFPAGAPSLADVAAATTPGYFPHLIMRPESDLELLRSIPHVGLDRVLPRLISDEALTRPIPTPAFVVDAVSGDPTPVTLPTDRYVHLDFEAGQAGYVSGLAAQHPERHYVAVDDLGLACKELFQLTKATAFLDMLAINAPNRLSASARYNRFFHRRRIVELFQGASECLLGAGDVTKQANIDQCLSSAYLRVWWRFVASALPSIAELVMHDASCAADSLESAYLFLGHRPDTAIFDTPPVRWFLEFQQWLYDPLQHPHIDVEAILVGAELSMMHQFFRTWVAPQGQAPANLTYIRAETSAEFGCTGIPLHDHTVHAISWIAPFRHHQDFAEIAAEFSRLLVHPWTRIEIATDRQWHREDLSPDDIDAIAGQLHARVERVADFAEPLTQTMHRHPRMEMHIYRLTPQPVQVPEMRNFDNSPLFQ